MTLVLLPTGTRVQWSAISNEQAANVRVIYDNRRLLMRRKIMAALAMLDPARAYKAAQPAR